MGRAVAGVMLAAALGLAAGGAALAETKRASNPFQGFSSDNGKPVDITSDALEVHQNEQMAIFSGNVVAKQGDSTLRAPKLTVYYDNANDTGKGDKPADAAKPADAGQQNADAGGTAGTPANSSIRRLEASGGVVVTSQDQKATGSDGVFDMASNTATLTGNVVLTQGGNVIRGKQLVVDLKTGIARVVGGTTGLFMPSSQNNSQKPKAN